MEKFEVQPESSEFEKRRKLRLLANALLRFVTVGTLILGSPAEKRENQSLAEYSEALNTESRERLLKAERENIESPPTIGFIPLKEGDIAPSSIDKYLKTLPKGWVRGELKSTRTATIGENPTAIMPQGETVFAEVNHNNGEIKFFPLASREVAEASFILRSIAHELGHLNDPTRDKDLSRQEKRRLFKKIKERIKSKNRFSKSYFIKLEKSFENGEININRLVTEYWAIICEQYMADPSRLSIEDFELVHWSAVKNEPNYNWREKLRERVQIESNHNNTTANQ